MKKMMVGFPLMACLLTLAGPAFAVAEQDQMVYGETTRLDTFDPYTVHEGPGQRLADLIFDGLVDVSPSGEYVPALAESWEVRDGGSVVVFRLRKDVRWHDDAAVRLVTPEDVITTVRLLTNPASEVPNRERFNAIRLAERAGEGSVAIHLSRAMVDPLRVMMFKILPAHIVGTYPSLKRDSEFARNPVGTGSYKFVKSNNHGEVLLMANPAYFRGTPRIAKVVMKSYSDQTVMAQSLMFNSLDLITYVSPRDIGEIMGDNKLSVLPYDALSFSFFGMNTGRGILRDKRVRQAISHAVNRQEMLDAFFQGKGRLISGPVPPTSWAYNLDVKPVAFDVTRARSLLGSAGLADKNTDGILESPGGSPVSLVFAVPMTGESEMIKRIVLAFQGYMEAVGLKVELQFMDWLVWKKKVLDEHDYDLTIASWSFDDASNITSLFHSSSAREWGNNFVMYRNTEVDGLLTEAEVTNDFDKRRAIYHKLHAILADEAPYVYLWTLQHHAAYSNRLTGVRVEPFSFFKYVSNWQLEPGHGAR